MSFSPGRALLGVRVEAGRRLGDLDLLHPHRLAGRVARGDLHRRLLERGGDGHHVAVARRAVLGAVEGEDVAGHQVGAARAVGAELPAQLGAGRVDPVVVHLRLVVDLGLAVDAVLGALHTLGRRFGEAQAGLQHRLRQRAAGSLGAPRRGVLDADAVLVGGLVGLVRARVFVELGDRGRDEALRVLGPAREEDPQQPLRDLVLLAPLVVFCLRGIGCWAAGLERWSWKTSTHGGWSSTGLPPESPPLALLVACEPLPGGERVSTPIRCPWRCSSRRAPRRRSRCRRACRSRRRARRRGSPGRCRRRLGWRAPQSSQNSLSSWRASIRATAALPALRWRARIAAGLRGSASRAAAGVASGAASTCCSVACSKLTAAGADAEARTGPAAGGGT